MRLLIISFLLTISLSLVAKDSPKYPVSSIPQKMKDGMYAVVREDFYRFEIVSINRSRQKVHKVITILNENGKRFATEAVFYDKLEKVVSVSGIAYDANGEVIKKLKNNEIFDRSAYDANSLYTDNRYKFMDLEQATYPYTVEFEYETETKYLYAIPTFRLYYDDEVSIEKETYEVEYPIVLKPRYKLNSIEEPRKERLGDNEKLVWSFTNIIPEKFEKYTSHNLIPHVMLAPTIFEYEGYRGSMASWKDYGLWQMQLNNGRDIVDAATLEKIKQLTQNLKSTEEKAKAVYEYVQSRTRYVNISLGIGGLQPFPADVVDKNGYGDCKALSNYTVALLKSIGIKGYFTTIQAGANEPEMILDFPSHQGNHVVVSVPNGRDTLWLECTSQTNPFGYSGTFTGNRYALMITEEGGKIVRTPKLKPEQNTQYQKAEVVLEKSGNAKAKVSTAYSGIQYEIGDLDARINSSFDEQKKWLQENLNIPSFELGTFSMINKKGKVPSAIVNVDLTLNRYASVSGKRIFITPNLMNRNTYIPPKLETRKNPVVFKNSYVDIDTIVYSIPEEIYPEFVPQPVKFSSRYGEYEANFKFDQGKLIYTRKLKMIPGEHPPAAYSELVDFYKNINKADNTKLVFLSKT
ncbi:MAG: DUF3857 domain-containing transglutaminase family protein [Cyclobacteriaceae bacterium]|nr:DUF3857 domain-containing transglutaminase family protein [Cyclobacteriaceae bacterium]